MQPLVADLQRNCANNVDFSHINIDIPANQAISRKYGITSVPRYLLLDSSGKVIKHWVGTVSTSEFDPVRQYCSQ